MKLRYLLLGSVCAMSVGIASGFADPQSGDPYTQNPTPQERVQTNDLNAQQQDQAQQPVAAAPTAADQEQYQQQLQQYQGQKDQYRSQQDRYRDERAEYNFDRSHPGDWWHDRYERASLNEFYDIPRDELIDLRVSRGDGYRVGHIRDVERRPDGRVARVKVVLHDGEFAWLDARDLRYDRDDRIVFTDLSTDEIYERARNS